MTAVFVILGTAEPEGSDPAGSGMRGGGCAPQTPMRDFRPRESHQSAPGRFGCAISAQEPPTAVGLETHLRVQPHPCRLLKRRRAFLSAGIALCHPERSAAESKDLTAGAG